ncbi:hypothetical protein HII28_07050 [Planctomonas sp. JC2975]|uniref:hypothetical protein n=1 Tax=Planctomonas sp. JC2975 TaxID=2729626 RepID=UPI0014753A7C|nr:hypothetical protein [Planctomonas sp. JC2975]NNC11632.1 hypothetical protein [Planctomonas sp. JC2975]
MTANDTAETGFRAVIMSEDSIYGLILVTGMIVLSNSLASTSLNALLTVVVTVIVFFAAHVYSRTIAHMATSRGHGNLWISLGAAAAGTVGMLVASVIPLVILLLGVSHFIDDDTAIWTAVIVDTVLLGILGWFAVARWTPHFWARISSALVTAAFGGVLALLKAVVHH